MQMVGKSSMSIFNSKGEEVMHTGSRKINTADELIETVEHFPEFLKILYGDKGGKNDKI